MVNKKEKENKFKIILVTFELILFFSLFTWAIVKNINQPEITIYKEVCIEEIVRTISKVTKTEPIYINCNKTITTDGMFKRCWDKERDSEWDCSEDYCLFQYDNYLLGSYFDTTHIQVRLENFTQDISKDIFETFNQTKEVCGFVEVENEIIWGSNGVWGPIKIGEEPWGIEWLDENCEIQKGECLKWGKRDSEGISICKEEIKKYACGDYIVEVEK